MKHAEWEYFQQMAVSRPVTQANPIMYDGKAAPASGQVRHRDVRERECTLTAIEKGFGTRARTA
jgi:hypothetical protein